MSVDIEEQIRALPHVDSFSIGFEKRPALTPSRLLQADLHVHVFRWRAMCYGDAFGSVWDIDPYEDAAVQRQKLLEIALQTLREVGHNAPR